METTEKNSQQIIEPQQESYENICVIKVVHCKSNKSNLSDVSYAEQGSKITLYEVKDSGSWLLG